MSEPEGLSVHQKEVIYSRIGTIKGLELNLVNLLNFGQILEGMPIQSLKLNLS